MEAEKGDVHLPLRAVPCCGCSSVATRKRWPRGWASRLQTVERIGENQLQDDKRIDPARVIKHAGMDEISLKKQHKLYVTVMTDLTDPESPKVLAVARGRDTGAARECLGKLSREQRAAVETHRLDMGKVYGSATSSFPIAAWGWTASRGQAVQRGARCGLHQRGGRGHQQQGPRDHQAPLRGEIVRHAVEPVEPGPQPRVAGRRAEHRRAMRDRPRPEGLKPEGRVSRVLHLKPEEPVGALHPRSLDGNSPLVCWRGPPAIQSARVAVAA